MLFKKAKTKDYKINFAYLTTSRDVNLCKIDNDVIEIKNSEVPIMDINSTGSTITKKRVDLWTLKAEEINLLDRKSVV